MMPFARPAQRTMNKERIPAAGSYLFVGIQLGSCLFLTLSGPVKPDHWWLALGPVAGVGLGLWSALEMRRSRLSPLPEVRPRAALVTTGPYRLLRHPIYAALLLVFVPLTLNRPSPARGAALGVLVLTLLLKMEYEEMFLRARFPEYRPYAARSWRIIPWIF